MNLPANMPKEFVETMKRYGLVQTAPGRFDLVQDPKEPPAPHDPALGLSVRDLMAAQGEHEIPDLVPRGADFMPEMMSPRHLPPTYGRK